MDKATFTIKPVEPFRLDFTVWALRRRAHNNIDRWDGQVYKRVFIIQGMPVEVAATQIMIHGHPILRVESRELGQTKNFEDTLRNVLNRVLGIDRNLAGFYSLSSKDAILEPLVRSFLGLKPPMFPTVFEALVNGIACQDQDGDPNPKP